MKIHVCQIRTNLIRAGLICLATLLAVANGNAQSANPVGKLLPDGSVERRTTDAPAQDPAAAADSATPAAPRAAQPSQKSSTPTKATVNGAKDIAELLSGSFLIDEKAAETVQRRIRGFESRLGSIEQALQRDDISFEAISGFQKRVLDISGEAADLAAKLKPMASSVERRLAGLALPDEGVEETETLANQRKQLNQARSVLTSYIKQLDVVSIQSNDLLARITAKRRALIEQFLFVRTSSLLDPEFWRSALAESPEILNGTTQILTDWVHLVVERAGPIKTLLAVLVLLAAGWFLLPAYRRLVHLGSRHEAVTEPPAHRRAVAAMAIILLATLPPLFLAIGVYTGLNALNLSPVSTDKAMSAVFASLVGYLFVQGMAGAILAPTRPNWRLVNLDNKSARKLSRASIAAAAVIAVYFAVAGLLDIVSAESEIKTLLAGIMAVAMSLLQMRALRTAARAIRRNEDEPERVSGVALVFRWLVPVFWLAAFAQFVAPLVGFIWLGWFLSIQVAWTVAVLAVLLLFLQLVDTTITAGFQMKSRVGRTLNHSLALHPATIEQVGVILSGFSRLVLIIVAIFAILVPWGLSSGDVVGFSRRALFGMQLGSVTLSLSAMFSAVLAFVLVVVFTRALQGWLEKSFLPHTRLDMGLKSSISTSFGYVGYIFAILLALSVAGLNLQNIAIVAGALSVGIGLGLQGIVNNFVSGLILLAERPIKVGDWVVIGTDQGYVRRINVRATEIETFERSTVLVPNSNLISGVVKNWMHGNSMGRVAVPLGVSYDADPQKVKDLLLACAKEHPLVLAYPAPNVFFMNFGASSLDFELRCFLGNIDFALTVASDLRFAIFKRLAEEGIEIPYPQQDLHVRDVEKLKSVFTSAAQPAPPPPGSDAS